MSRLSFKGICYVTFILILLFSVITGCGNASLPEPEESKSEKGASEESSFPINIKDDNGKEITIEKKPKKIVSLLPSTTEVLFALGLDKEIVGVSDYDNYPKAATTKQKVGSQDMNVELILSLLPDVIFLDKYHADSHGDVVKQLESAGIKTVTVGTQNSFAETYDSMQLIAKVTGTEAEAEKIISTMKAKVEEIKLKSKKVEEKKKVWIEISPQPDIYTTGKNTFMNEMLEMIGAENAAAHLEGWVKVSEEEAVNLNPDVVITTYGLFTENAEQQVLERKGWQGVSAVKNEQVFDVNNDSVTRSGPRLIDGVEELAKAVYPDIYK